MEGYRDTFRRLDEIALTLGGVANKLDTLAAKQGDGSDKLLSRFVKSLSLRVESQLDLTGLRGDRPDAVPLEQCFIVPEVGLRENILSPSSYFGLGDTEEIVKEFSRVGWRLLYGAPGAGKSTFSLWLQRQLLGQDARHAAVLVRLREVIKQTDLPSYHDLVRAAAGTHMREEIAPAIVEEWCERGAMTFILDGFDEIPVAKRDDAVAWISEFADAASNARLIITSRPLTTPHLESMRGWNHWMLQPFDKKRISDYIARWYAYAPVLVDSSRRVDADALAGEWLEDPILRPLAGSPLMLATLLMVHHMDGQLPRGRSKVYARYVDGMLGLWDSRWGIASNIALSPSLKKKILTRLALHFHLEEVEQVGDDEIFQVMSDLLPKLGCSHSPNEILDYLRERTGLLVGPGTWNFVHKSVGEFFVASAILEGDASDKSGERLDRFRLLAERYNDRWNTIVFFWAGLASAGDLQSFIDQVISEATTESFRLALGIVFDQLESHRLTADWLAVRLRRLLADGFDADVASSISYILDPTPRSFSVSCDIPSVEVRSVISGNFSNSSPRIIVACVTSCGLRWGDLSSVHDTVLPTLWFEFGTNCFKRRELLELFSSPRAKLKLKDFEEVGLFWGVSSFVRETDGDVDLRAFCEIYLSYYPSVAGILIFALLSAFNYWVESRRGDNILGYEYLRLLNDLSLDTIDLAWLGASDNFEGLHDDSAPEIDLLDTARAHLRSISNEDNADIHLIRVAEEQVASMIRIRTEQAHSYDTTRDDSC